MTSKDSEKCNRAAVYAEPGTVKTEVVELPIPTPGPGEILVRLLYSGVCHTDYAFCMNKISSLPVPTAKGQVGGHEGVGEVVAQGAGVDFPEVGAKVGIKFAADACLSCTNCLEGFETGCSKLKVSGYYTPGTFQQYCLSTARYATPIPEGIDLVTAAPLMCGGLTVYASLKRSGVQSGDWVLVSGAGGGLGHLAIQYAKVMGARVLALDIGSKEALCREVGADNFIDVLQLNAEQLASRVEEITSGGAKIAMICTGNVQAYEQALSWLGFRGTLICLGIPDKEGALRPEISRMIDREIRIQAYKASNRLEAKECLEIAARKGIKVHSQLRKLEELSDVFQEMEDGKVKGRVVLDLS